MLYVGEGAPICPKLASHYAQKDFWTRAIGFTTTAKQLNKAHVQFLESRLIALARAAKASPVLTCKGKGVLAMQGALYQFTQDYTFSAPSTAAAVVLGRSANGRVEWKAVDGRTLKEIQEAEAGQ